MLQPNFAVDVKRKEGSNPYGTTVSVRSFPSPPLLAERFSMSVILSKIKDQTGEGIFRAMLRGKFIR